MKRYIWQPLAFLCVGLTFYIYYGITWNAWIKNIWLIIGYVVILAALSWALYKKEQYKNNNNS